MTFRAGAAFRKYLLIRRRADPWLFSLAVATTLIWDIVSVSLFAYFAGTGIYLAIFRPKTLRIIDPRYGLAALVFAAGALAIHLLNGSLPEDGRYASYPLYPAMMLPILPGMFLIRDPLRQLVIGARLAVIVLAVWAVIAVSGGAGRYGFGLTASNAAFSITFLAIVSRLEVKNAPRWLGNRTVWFYLALIAVLATGTRAVLPVFVLAAGFDLARGFDRQNPSGLRRGRIAATAAAILLAAVAAAWLLAPSIEKRLTDTATEIDALSREPDPSGGGLPVRILLWRAAGAVIADHPLTGTGGQATIAELNAHLPNAHRELLSQLSFSHNFILDEWMQRGIFGVILMLGFYGCGFARVSRFGTPDIRENAILVAALMLAFGALHYLLLVDRHVALAALYLLILTAANRGFHPPYRHAVTGGR